MLKYSDEEAVAEAAARKTRNEAGFISDLTRKKSLRFHRRAESTLIVPNNAV